jgi:hypothetical protein
MGFGRVVSPGEYMRRAQDVADIRYGSDGKAYSRKTGKRLQGSRYYRGPKKESLSEYKARALRMGLQA